MIRIRSDKGAEVVQTALNYNKTCDIAVETIAKNE